MRQRPIDPDSERTVAARRSHLVFGLPASFGVATASGPLALRAPLGDFVLENRRINGSIAPLGAAADERPPRDAPGRLGPSRQPFAVHAADEPGLRTSGLAEEAMVEACRGRADEERAAIVAGASE